MRGYILHTNTKLHTKERTTTTKGEKSFFFKERALETEKKEDSLLSKTSVLALRPLVFLEAVTLEYPYQSLGRDGTRGAHIFVTFGEGGIV